MVHWARTEQLLSPSPQPERVAGLSRRGRSHWCARLLQRAVASAAVCACIFGCLQQLCARGHRDTVCMALYELSSSIADCSSVLLHVHACTHTHTAVLYYACHQQGLLAYFYRHAHPELGLAADRCKYNYMWDTEECRRYVNSDVICSTAQTKRFDSSTSLLSASIVQCCACTHTLTAAKIIATSC
jgi:hypothetical protein